MHGANEAGVMPGKEKRVIYNAYGNSTVGFAGNLPLVYTEKILERKKWNLFGSTYGADADVLVNSSIALFDFGLYLAWVQWNAELEKKKAKL